jgi:hypothetical protein
MTGAFFECGHHRRVKPRRDGLYELTACAVCAALCPHQPCRARPGHVCRTPSGAFSRTHRERIEAAGVTCRRVTDRGISPELAKAVDLFHDAMHAWRGAAIDESMTRKLSNHRRATVVDDRAVVEALLRAGWTPPNESGPSPPRGR